MESTWIDITHGSNWKNSNTGRMCIVTRPPIHAHDVVGLLHQSGRSTSKQVHYFLYDFEKVILPA